MLLALRSLWEVSARRGKSVDVRAVPPIRQARCTAEQLAVTIAPIPRNAVSTSSALIASREPVNRDARIPP